RPFLSLSYGERRLTLLARTLASRSKLLLLDELLNGLDEVNRARALRWLRHTRRSRLPWVLTTHRAEDVPDCVTHALVLEQGKIVYRGKAATAPLRRWLNQGPRLLPVGPRLRERSSRDAAKPSRKHAKGTALLKLTRASVYLDE